MKNANTRQSLIRHEQVFMLYNTSLNASFGNLLAAYLLAYVQWNTITHSTIIIWLGCLTLLAGIRVGFQKNIRRKQPTPQQIASWATAYNILIATIALVWGSAGIFLFPEANLAYQAVTILILVTVSSGAVSTLSALRTPVLVFLLGSMSPIIIRLFIENTELSNAFAFICSIYVLYTIIASSHIYKIHLQNITIHVESLHREHKLVKSEQLTVNTSQILEMIATGKPAHDIYDAIALLYESRHPGLRCAIFQLEKGELIFGGAPSFNRIFHLALENINIAPDVGSCGPATHTGKRVLVKDINLDPRWDKLRKMSRKLNIRSAWAEPIKSSNGTVLGAFDMYYSHPALPNDEELSDLKSGADLAAIVMERERREVLLEKLHRAFECAHNAFLIVNLDAKIEYVNAAFEKMTGYTQEEAVGEFMRILRSDKHPPSFYDELSKQDKLGTAYCLEITIKCKDGSFLDVERTISPVSDNEGKVLYLIVIQRDLTEQKKLEEKFQQAQKMEAVGTLVGGIAHDFNNLLAGITGNLYLAQAQLDVNSDLSKKLQRIDQLSARAADLIQQMLTFARKDTVSMGTLPLNSLVKEAFKFLNTSIPENIEINLYTNQDDISIHGDATQVHQVLLNLANNARDAVEHSSQPSINITLESVQADSAYIERYQFLKEGFYAHISVKDNGIGIPKESMGHLFEPFFTTKEVGKGTGLGLSMVFGAVKRHKGFIEVESIEGEGSTFHIYLPAFKTQAPKQQNEPPTLTPSTGNQETILFVDDEAGILDMGTEVLGALGYTVLQASNGLEAIDLFTEHQESIALIITDIVMPKLGGVEAIARIREIKPDIPVIFATGYDRDTALTKQIIANDDDVLSKPYRIAELSKLIAYKLS